MTETNNSDRFALPEIRVSYGDVRDANVLRTRMARILSEAIDVVSQKYPKITKKMIVELIIPIETLRGKLKEDGYYFRVCKGKQIVQRNPTKWRDTPARKAARERFVARFARKKTG